MHFKGTGRGVAQRCPKVQQCSLIPASPLQPRRLEEPSKKPSYAVKKQHLSLQRRTRVVLRNALGTNNHNQQDKTEVVYYGVYGPWSIKDSDIIEVWSYRASITVFTLAFLIESFRAQLGGLQYLDSITIDNTVCAIGALGLGVALVQVHIYVNPLKRMLQLFWLAGVIGSGIAAFAWAAPSHLSLIQYTMENATTVWLVGPLFAALTGLTFKEGLCYGKAEAFLLTCLIPVFLLGHLSGLASPDVEHSIDGAIGILLLVFAARKYTQPIKDDIGDGSVFEFQKMSPEEQQNLLMKLSGIPQKEAAAESSLIDED